VVYQVGGGGSLLMGIFKGVFMGVFMGSLLRGSLPNFLGLKFISIVLRLRLKVRLDDRRSEYCRSTWEAYSTVLIINSEQRVWSCPFARVFAPYQNA
jgi:hypothetical protein